MNNLLKTVFYLLLFYLLFIFQTSFAFRFGAPEIFFFFIVFCLLILIIFEDINEINGVLAAIFVGLMWDFFSLRIIGFHAFFLGLTAVAIKSFLRIYVWPLPQRP